MKNGLKNLFIWFKVIWNDRWWDNYYFFKILHKKLSLMEENFREDGVHLFAEKDANKMKRCVLVLERLMNDDYDANASTKNSLKERIEHADYLRQQDVDYLFEILRKNILTWWD